MAGKTAQVTFDIIDIGPDKDAILRLLGHQDYALDISYKDGGHLRPHKEPYPTNVIGTSGSQKGSAPGKAPSIDPPQETDNA